MTVNISLSTKAEIKLRERAAAAGEQFDEYVSRVLEVAATKPTVDEVLAPFRKQVAEGGMSNEELDAFFEDVRGRAFEESRRPSA